MATVSGFATVIISSTRLSGVDVIVLETRQKMATTDHLGNFSFKYPADQPMTLLFKKNGFHSSQSATFIVPEKGFSVALGNAITYQAIGNIEFSFAKFIEKIVANISYDPNTCLMVATVSKKNSTIDDPPQGEAEALLFLTNELGKKLDVKLCYLDVFLKKTLPSCYDKISKDGGVLAINIPKGSVFNVSASKAGVKFNSQKVICNQSWWDQHAPKETKFINLSPPQLSVIES